MTTTPSIAVARAVTDELFATAEDPDEVAARHQHDLARKNAEGVDRWREWLGDHLDECLALSDDEIDARPDLIYWLFPICGHSAGSAPVIGRHAMRQAVQTDPTLGAALLKSYSRVLQTFGISDSGALHWRAWRPVWALRASPADRRLSRMLHCLHNAGLVDQAEALMAFLQREFGGDSAHAMRLSWWRHQVLS